MDSDDEFNQFVMDDEFNQFVMDEMIDSSTSDDERGKLLLLVRQ